MEVWDHLNKRDQVKFRDLIKLRLSSDRNKLVNALGLYGECKNAC